jgi:hypothetical protein
MGDCEWLLICGVIKTQQQMRKITILGMSAILMATMIVSCSKDATVGKDINTSARVSVDRFSAAAGHLMVRSATNGLPAPNVAIAFDNAPFITTGLDKNGAVIKYYNFDVQSITPDDIYVFFKAGASTPITGQNNVIPTIPGETGYSDFWRVNMVTVPDSYVPNTLTSEAAIKASGYTITRTNMIVNCPVVPAGSTCTHSFAAGVATSLSLGWYKDQVVSYFSFGEKDIMTTAAGLVPVSKIYVMFNIDPSTSNPSSGPASGFKTEAANTSQTHNVLSTLPTDATYSPLWDVQVIGNSNFASITNLATATGVTSDPAGATVNCPVLK